MAFTSYLDLSPLGIGVALLEISIIAYLLYRFLLLIRGTRAVQLIRGLVVLVIAANLSGWLHLRVIGWLLTQLWGAIIVALAVVFQPELRRALEQLGRGQMFAITRSELAPGDIVRVIDEIIAALVACAKTKTGALIVLERDTGLNDYIETGVLLDAAITQEFLVNVFVPNTPLHDGAAIVRGDRVAAAACFLPLTDNPYISTSLGTRHRAGIGISEVSDAISLIVSEETGIISLARNGKLVRSLDEKQLRESLSTLLTFDSPKKLFRQKEPARHE